MEVCRDVRSVDPDIKALILTSYDDDEALFSAIMAGAAGYILKQVRGQRPGRHGAPGGGRRVDAGPVGDRARCSSGCATARRATGELEALTTQEQKILDLIGEGLTNRQIAERMFLAEKTVKNYVSSLLAKLGLDQPHPGRDLRDQAPAALSGRGAGQRSRSRRPLTLSTSMVS